MSSNTNPELRNGMCPSSSSNLACPIQWSCHLRVGKHETYPWVKPTDFIKTMARCGDLGKFLGGKPSLKDAGPLLKEFWRRYKLAFPQHEVFTKGVSGPPVFARRRRSDIQEIRSPFGIISRSHRLWFKENTKSICTDSRRSFSGESWNPCQLLENWIAKSFFVWNRPQGRSNSRNLN